MLKRLIAMLLCILTVLTGSAMAETFKAVTPYVNCSTLKEASEIAGFEIDAPEKVDGCTVTIQAWKDELIEIRYDNGENTLIVRKGKGESDVSGDYTVYAKTTSYSLEGMTATLKGNGDLPTLITWSHNGYSFSLSCSTGMDKDHAISAMKRLSGIRETKKKHHELIIGGDPRTWGPVE